MPSRLLSSILAFSLSWTAFGQGPGDDPDWCALGPPTPAGVDFGASLAEGDFDGDGYGDLVVGLPLESDATVRGAAVLYRGGPDGLADTPSWRLEGEGSLRLGGSLRGLGDVNGDGVDDLGVGLPLSNGGGSVLIFYGADPLGFNGGNDATIADADWTLDNAQTNGSQLGWSLESRLDVDGDGYPDLLVGQPFYNAGAYAGAVHLFYGSAAGIHGGVDATLADADWTFTLSEVGSLLGKTLTRIGRFDGDEYDDFAVGSDQHDNWNGVALVFLGGPRGQGPVLHRRFEGTRDNPTVGTSLAGGTDFDLDGFDDLAMGQPRNGWHSGSVTLLYGGSGGIGRVQVIDGHPATDGLGHCVACPGDLHGDGYADLLVGSPGHSTPDQVGKVALYRGSADGVHGFPEWTALGERDHYGGAGSVGSIVAAAGDVNDDSIADLLHAAPSWVDGAGDPTGKVWCYHGSGPTFEGKGGLSIAPDQVIPNPDPGVRVYGWVMARGNLNGDEYEDVAVGYPLAYGRGAVWVHKGTAAGLDPDPWFQVVGAHRFGQFGASIACADTDGDGDDDLVVGARGEIHPYPWEYHTGYVMVFFGESDQMDPSPSWVGWSSLVDHYGSSVASLGDLDGDGDEEIAVGATGNVQERSDEPFPDVHGSVFVYLGSPAGPNDGTVGTESNAAWSARSDALGDLFGHAIAGPGDLDGSSIADVSVSAIQGSQGGVAHAGAVYSWDGLDVLSGVPGTPGSAMWTDLGQGEGTRLGLSLAAIGDVDGDGARSLAMGSFERGADGELGAARVRERDSLWERRAHSWAGISVGGGGDFNGDGFDDLVLGWPAISNTLAGEGRVELVLGERVGGSLCDTPLFFFHGEEPGAHLGHQTLLADVDGDGLADLVASAPEAGAGELRIWFGRERPWLTAEPELVQASDPLTVSAFGGEPHALFLLYVGAVDGSPFLQRILTSRLDDDSLFEITGPVPPNLAGHDFTLFGITLNCRGKPLESNSVLVTVQ